MSEIEIREALPADAEGIQDVFYRTWLTTYPNAAAGVTIDDVEDRFRTRRSPEILAQRRLGIENSGPNEKRLVALDGENVVGLCNLAKNEKEQRLKGLYVLPEYQGRGVGSALWQRARTFFDPTVAIVVGVATYNEQAIGFYARQGFVDTGRRYEEERLRMKSGAIIPQMDMVLKRA